MKSYIYSFTEEGVEEFRKCISDIRNGKNINIPSKLIHNTDGRLIHLESDKVEIENKQFSSKMEVARYLDQKINEAEIDDPFSNVGLWTWLSAFYFDQVCPLKNNKRKVGEDARYVMALGWNRIYRHLLAGPTIMYNFHGESAIIMLYDDLSTMGDFVEQLMSRQDIAQNSNLIEVSKRIYWDSQNGMPIKGVRQKKHKPGTLRRFTDIIQQLDLTYDLYSMEPKEIINLLPHEFDEYLKIQA